MILLDVLPDGIAKHCVNVVLGAYLTERIPHEELLFHRGACVLEVLFYRRLWVGSRTDRSPVVRLRATVGVSPTQIGSFVFIEQTICSPGRPQQSY